MYNVPSQPSDAGPLDWRRDPDGEPCSNCQTRVTRPQSYRCQGALPDDCINRVCEDCRQTCDSCGLTACGEHAVDYSGERFCRSCMALEIEAAADTLAALTQQADEIGIALEATRA